MKRTGPIERRSPLSRTKPLQSKGRASAQAPRSATPGWLDRLPPGQNRSEGLQELPAEGVEIQCEGCGKGFKVKAKQLSIRKFCSFECRVAVGKVKAQGRRRAKPAWSVRVKGETSCRIPGCPRRDLALHHVIPRAIGTRESKTNLLNGMTLCASHHTRWHAGTYVITRNHFTSSEWEYLTSVKLTGRDIIGWLDKHYPEHAFSPQFA